VNQLKNQHNGSTHSGLAYALLALILAFTVLLCYILYRIQLAFQMEPNETRADGGVWGGVVVEGIKQQHEQLAREEYTPSADSPHNIGGAEGGGAEDKPKKKKSFFKKMSGKGT
jgi:hypothetical protein